MWLKARLLFRRETLFPGYTVQTKLTASLLKMRLEQSSKMINRASISHKGLTFESTSRQRHKRPEMNGEDRLTGYPDPHIDTSSGHGAGGLHLPSGTKVLLKSLLYNTLYLSKIFLSSDGSTVGIL